LLAALLHDIGKGIDPDDHVESGIAALEGAISERTAWLIRHHMDAHRIRERTIGSRAHRRLRDNESYDELLLLGQCDQRGRKQGVDVTTLEDAIQYIRDLDYVD
jgi:predicted HD phosphohydrolase